MKPKNAPIASPDVHVDPAESEDGEPEDPRRRVERQILRQLHTQDYA